MSSRLRLGQVFRYPKNKKPHPPELDGYPNFHYVTRTTGHKGVQLERGINVPTAIAAIDGSRRPLILLRSSPWKSGTVETPWFDDFEREDGGVRYYGDHKVGMEVALGKTPGNAAMLEAFEHHRVPSPHAVPLLLFRAVSRHGKKKGYVEFCGVGVMERFEKVEQWSKQANEPFVNYAYDISLIDLTPEEDTVAWEWIEARRNKAYSAEETLEWAPKSWRHWVENGTVGSLRSPRRGTVSENSKPKERKPETESPEVLEAEEAAARTAGRRRSGTGQGRRMSADERKALEDHSVGRATAHFEADGWSVEDVGAKEPYDLLLTRGDERLHVEVKGTTSQGAQVILTRAEVEKQREFAPHNALVVVHSIELDRTVSPPKAKGGVLHCTSPWEIREQHLKVVSYVYHHPDLS
ncbi:protein NO VEIN domain-containing protein [Nocardiopsis alba]|uniref:protein NO VEIN domain-containing protein n=1 Tax=Nocardiopsis alba TaxID=53437 RepID=UPI00366DF809